MPSAGFFRCFVITLRAQGPAAKDTNLQSYYVQPPCRVLHHWVHDEGKNEAHCFGLRSVFWVFLFIPEGAFSMSHVRFDDWGQPFSGLEA